MNYNLIIVVLLSILVGFGRFLVPGHDLSLAGSYEALAHIWVGVLITLAFFVPKTSYSYMYEGYLTSYAAMFFLGSLTILEAIMFFLR